MLDVGCGIKPYLPFFEPYAGEYVGVDLVENPAADLEGSVEALPVEDASLRPRPLHAGARALRRSRRAVRELRRVTAPGGRVLASTHGVQVYHPSPDDYWRWTHTGLERLFAQNGDWAQVDRHARRRHRDLPRRAARDLRRPPACARRISTPLARARSCRTLNSLGGLVDRAVPSLRAPIPGSLFLNYHVVADEPK